MLSCTLLVCCLFLFQLCCCFDPRVGEVASDATPPQLTAGPSATCTALPSACCGTCTARISATLPSPSFLPLLVAQGVALSSMLASSPCQSSRSRNPDLTSHHNRSSSRSLSHTRILACSPSTASCKYSLFSTRCLCSPICFSSPFACLCRPHCRLLRSDQMGEAVSQSGRMTS